MAIDLKTYGDLKKLIKAISVKQKGEKIISQGKEFALDQLLGLIPGASNAKTAFNFFSAAFKKPDTKKTGTWLDKLDIDDDMSNIVDDTVENGFMKALSATLEKEPDTKLLEPDFNMNAKMVDYLRSKHNGRFVSGIKENINNKNKKMAKYNFENLSPDEQTKLKEYVESVKEIKKEIKKLIKKSNTKKIESEGGNMSSGLTLSAD
jgi:hypothetical protein